MGKKVKGLNASSTFCPNEHFFENEQKSSHTSKKKKVHKFKYHWMSLVVFDETFELPIFLIATQGRSSSQTSVTSSTTTLTTTSLSTSSTTSRSTTRTSLTSSSTSCSSQILLNSKHILLDILGVDG